MHLSRIQPPSFLPRRLNVRIGLLITAIMCLPAAAAADDLLDYGEYLSGECTSCHHRDGADKGIPPIVGWPEPQFIAVLESYKTGDREHEVMQNVARSLGVEEIAALARYFNQIGNGNN